MKNTYPRPKKKSPIKRFKENFDLNDFMCQIAFMTIMAIMMLLFLWICWTVKGPTWGYL